MNRNREGSARTTFDPISQESLNGLMVRIENTAMHVKEAADKGKVAAAIILGGLGVLFLGSILGGGK